MDGLGYEAFGLANGHGNRSKFKELEMFFKNKKFIHEAQKNI